MFTDLQGRGAFVTGGGSSVGKEIALRLAAQGAKVYICDVNHDAVQQTVDESKGKIQGEALDVCAFNALRSCVSSAQDWTGGVDYLVNVVGVGGPRGLTETLDLDDWTHTFNANVTATLCTMQEVIPRMKEKKFGAIVNFSTGSTRTRLPNRSAYVASKYAVEGLTLNAARELGPYSITCNAILPGVINNERMRGIIEANAASQGLTVEAMEAEYLRFISTRRKIELEELASMVSYLTSPAAKNITGELIAVSGNLEWEA